MASQVFGMSDRLTQTRELLDQEKYLDALTLLEESEQATPDWLTLKGRALSGLHRWDEAMDAFRGALDINGDSHEALTGIGLLQFLTGDLNSALVNFGGAVQRAQGIGRYRGLRGLVYSQLGRHGEALTDFEAAFELGDRDPSHMLARGQILIAAGRVEDAEKALAQADAHGAEANALSSLRASICMGSGDQAGALKHLRQAVIEEPAEVQGWWQLLGMVGQAERHNLADEVARALEHHPDDERILVLAAAKRREDGQIRSAIKLLEEAYERQTDSVVLLEMLGDYLREVNDLNGSLKCFEQALKMAPDSARAHFGLGLATTERSEALSHFDKAAELEPGNAVYQYHLGAVLSGLGQYQDALGPLSKAIEADPKFWRAYHERSICYENMGSFGKAARDREQSEAVKA